MDMIPHSRLLYLALVAASCLMFTSVIMSADETAGETQVLEGGYFHVNMKAMEELSPETKEDRSDAGEFQHVDADYDENSLIIIGTRGNARWVDVGTWTTSSRDSNFIIYGDSITFNIWYEIAGEMADDSQCTFRFTLLVDDAEIAQAEGPEETPEANTIVEYTAHTNDFSETDVPVDSVLKLKVEYKALEDCDIHFDCANYDSGFWVEANFVKVFGYSASTTSVQIEIYDGFSPDWIAVSSYFVLEVAGNNTSFGDPSISEGKSREYNGSKLKTTFIEWVFDTPIENGQSVSLFVAYTIGGKDDAAYELSVEAGSGSVFGGGDDDDDDDFEIAGQDGYMVSGIIAAVAGGGAAGAFFVIRKRREEDDEDYEEDDEEEYEDEDE